ncbi:hypothetical protein EDD15DRAFT_2312577 [Pisolithus albus]|nr:hypothetical protein EDD15DRAFT_2312577 [Pisolithus albus]
MDFACGTGLISRELAPHAKSIVGVDISQNMVDMYNLSVHNQGKISPDELEDAMSDDECRRIVSCRHFSVQITSPRSTMSPST